MYRITILLGFCMTNGEQIMLTTQSNEQGLYPEWTSTTGLELWEPDSLYIEWLTFLYLLWERVDYL